MFYITNLQTSDYYWFLSDRYYTIRLHRYFQIIKREIGFSEAISLLYKKECRYCVDANSKGVLSPSVDTALPQEFSIVSLST